MTKPRKKPWFKRYDETKSELQELRAKYVARCKQLGMEYRLLTGELWKEFVSRAVHESNWQEGIKLDLGRTRELGEEAYKLAPKVVGPHVDFRAILEKHDREVRRMKRKHQSVEEMAAFNLTVAHHCLWIILTDVVLRESAGLVRRIRASSREFEEGGKSGKLTPDKASSLVLQLNAIEQGLRTGFGKSNLPDEMTQFVAGGAKSLNDLLDAFLDTDHETLGTRVRIHHLHFLHTLVLTGIKRKNVIGRFRSTSVHIPGADIVFAPASPVPALMNEYCNSFPSFIQANSEVDPFMEAAIVSHRFVRIHPYADGNGRVSRLLMNMILANHDYLPVYLRASSEGSRRYLQSLNRANNGNYQWLAALIANQAVEVYKRALDAIAKPRESGLSKGR